MTRRAGEEGRAGRGPVVLIVDGDSRSRERMRAALQAEGYRVETAGGGFEGLRQFGDGTEIDLVLVDRRLPEMEGLAALTQMRERDPAARLVLLSDGGTVRLASEAVRSGASGFLLKDCSAALLCQAVRGYLSSPRAEVAGLDRSHGALLPSNPDGAAPRVRIRTLNGFTFWRVQPPGGDEEREGRINRIYGVRSPWGERCLCEVEVAPAVQSAVAAEIGSEVPAADPLWDVLCQLTLSNHLWRTGDLPPGDLPLRLLSHDQRGVISEAAERTRRAAVPR